MRVRREWCPFAKPCGAPRGCLRSIRVRHRRPHLRWSTPNGTKTPWPEPHDRYTTGRVEKQAGVGIESLLSPPVELTKSSAAQFKADAKSIAGQTVRMTKASMMLLRAFITIHRGDLLNEVEGSGEESEAEGDE